MVWFKVDDGMPSHRKVLSIPRGARRLTAVGAWTLGGAWASGSLTEGRIPKAVLDDLGIPTKVAADLVMAGLWLDHGDHYLMHDFLDYNPTAEQVQRDREAAAARQRKAREKASLSRLARAQETSSHAVTDGVTTTVTHGVSHAPVTPLVTVPPTRPDPARSSLREDEGQHTRSAAPPASPSFDAWYAAYPRKVAKIAARKAYDRAVKTTDPDVLLAATRHYANDPKRQAAELRFTPHPATWLNEGRWEDAPQSDTWTQNGRQMTRDAQGRPCPVGMQHLEPYERFVPAMTS